MESKSYKLIAMPSSFCPKCGANVNLLIAPLEIKYFPQFFICSKCDYVGNSDGELSIETLSRN